MNSSQNANNPLGEVLSAQQQLLADHSLDSCRYFWLSFATLNSQNSELMLQQLLSEQQALSCNFAAPQGFDIIRRHVQSPRLDFRVYHSHNVNQGSIEKQANLVFEEQSPHLLVWLFPGHNEVRVLLAGRALTLDDYSADKIYQLLNNQQPIGTPAIQYNQYCQWIETLLNEEEAEQGNAFWQGLKLTDLPQAKLNECAKPKNQYDCVKTTLPATKQINTLLGVWAVLLSKLSGNNELKLHYFHDCRHDYQDFANTLGLFTQPLPLPFYQLERCTLQDVTQSITALLEEALEYQEYVKVVDDKTLPQAGFYWHKQQRLNQMNSSGLISHCPLLLHYTDTNQGEAGLTIRYDTGCYSQSTINQLLTRFTLLLDAATEQPQLSMQQLDCLLPDEQPKSVCALTLENDFVTLFTHQAQAWPDNLALTDGQHCYTYQQLDVLSNQYAGVLQQAGAGREKIVALCLARTAQTLVCMLAILKSGAAYLPLDVNQPQARLQQIIDDAQPVILITESINLTANKQLSITQLAQTQAHFAAINIQLNQLAYVLYTSGSTGKPKGVLVEHQQLIHYNQSVSKQLLLPPNGHYGLISTLAADLGNTMLFPAWLTASCVHLLSDDLATDGYALSQYCQSSPLDCLKIVPSHLEALLCGGIKGDGNATLLPTDVLILGGEPISPSLIELLKALAPTCTIYNHYGPTETTVGVMFAKVDLNNNHTRLTTAIGDNQIYLLDEQLKPVVNGQQGQLYVAGSSVSRGYLNDVNRTDLVYLDNPFSAGRMYHTGDLAVRHADFSIDILGRSDQQVKIRGFRLELEEIVAQLTAHSQVSQANIQVVGQGETAKLIAFVVVTKGAVLSEPALLAHLATQLPHYMVPTQLHQLVQLPLNANGKIDRQQLLNRAAQQGQQTHEPAKNTIEKQLLNIWQAVLQQQNIGVTDDFFTIGGHSLAAIKIVAKIRQQMNISLPNNFLFHHRSIKNMAKHLITESSQTKRLINLTPNDSEHTMVLMHSHAGHFNYHQQFIANLAQDISLFGLTPNEKLWQLGTINEVIEDYATQLKPLKSKPLLLAGWSLGAKLMVLLAKRLAELEFDITAVAVIDFDLGQKLNTTDTAKQLIGDFEDYLAAQSLSFDIDAIKDSLSGSYQQAMTQLLNHSTIKSIIGEDISNASLVQQLMMRWHIKQKLYQTQLSPVNIPLWVWRGNSHHYGAQIWQPYTNQPIESHFIDADHYAILDTKLLAKQLIHNIQSHQSVEQQP